METEPLSVLSLMPFLNIDLSIVIQFAVFILLLFCSALISGAEVALFSLTPAEIETLKEEKTPTGNIIAKLAENPKKLLATVLIANNLANISIVLGYGQYLMWAWLPLCFCSAVKFCLKSTPIATIFCFHGA